MKDGRTERKERRNGMEGRRMGERKMKEGRKEGGKKGRRQQSRASVDDGIG
jgi:hypothetical protein